MTENRRLSEHKFGDMESMMQNINKVFLFILFSAICTNSVAQIHKYSLNITYDWKCVKHDYRGIEKFTFEQAEEIRKSILHIEAHLYYFKNVSFIKKCTFYEWKIKPFDAYDLVQSLEMTYTKTQLKKIFLLDPVDIDGNTACYNECSFFKRKDTLISDCGGYIFYWVKMKHK